MGQTALLSLRRKSCYGFLSPLKTDCPRTGLNPRTVGPMASTLPLDHRERHNNTYNICIRFATLSLVSRIAVSIVSGYGMDDRAIEVRSPAEAKGFSCSLCVQTGPGAHPASCTMGTGGLFPGAKLRPGRDADHSPPSSAEVENEYELYLLSTQEPPWRAVKQL
jgi:hypothetical protein